MNAASRKALETALLFAEQAAAVIRGNQDRLRKEADQLEEDALLPEAEARDLRAALEAE